MFVRVVSDKFARYSSIGVCKRWKWSNAKLSVVWGDGFSAAGGPPISEIGLEFKASLVVGLSSHSLVVSDKGKIWGWGRPFEGQLGSNAPNSKVDWRTPTPIAKLDQSFISGTVGGFHSLLVSDSNRCWSFGFNRNGQLGHQTTQTIYEPTQIESLVNIIKVAAGDEHSVAVDGSFLSILSILSKSTHKTNI